MDVPAKYKALNIFIVDDNMMKSYLAAEPLKKLEQEVTTAGDGKAGLAALEKGAFDVAKIGDVDA